MTSAELDLANARRARQKAWERATVKVDALQQAVWMARRNDGHSHVAARIGDDLYECQVCGLDMGT